MAEGLFISYLGVLTNWHGKSGLGLEALAKPAQGHGFRLGRRVLTDAERVSGN